MDTEVYTCQDEPDDKLRVDDWFGRLQFRTSGGATVLLSREQVIDLVSNLNYWLAKQEEKKDA